MRLIDADKLMIEFEVAQKAADQHGREFTNCFYDAGGEISTNWYCVEDMVDNAPTVDAVPVVHGRWVESDTDGFVCSVCRNGYKNQPTIMGEPMFEYCPVCGAKMHGKGGDGDVAY